MSKHMALLLQRSSVSIVFPRTPKRSQWGVAEGATRLVARSSSVLPSSVPHLRPDACGVPMTPSAPGSCVGDTCWFSVSGLSVAQIDPIR
jgi:hypothetical protein